MRTLTPLPPIHPPPAKRGGVDNCDTWRLQVLTIHLLCGPASNGTRFMRLHQIKRLFADLLLAKKYEMQKEEKERAKILSHIPWGVFRMHSHDKQLRPYFQKHKQLIYQWCSLSKCCCRGVKVFVISKLKLEAGEGGQGVSDDGYLHLHRHVNTLSALGHNTTILPQYHNSYLVATILFSPDFDCTLLLPLQYCFTSCWLTHWSSWET